jgi:hypothetical protein
MDDTPTTLLVAERDESTRAFLLIRIAATGTRAATANAQRHPSGTATNGSASPASRAPAGAPAAGRRGRRPAAPRRRGG